MKLFEKGSSKGFLASLVGQIRGRKDISSDASAEDETADDAIDAIDLAEPFSPDRPSAPETAADAGDPAAPPHEDDRFATISDRMNTDNARADFLRLLAELADPTDAKATADAATAPAMDGTGDIGEIGPDTAADESETMLAGDDTADPDDDAADLMADQDAPEADADDVATIPADDDAPDQTAGDLVAEQDAAGAETDHLAAMFAEADKPDQADGTDMATDQAATGAETDHLAAMFADGDTPDQADAAEMAASQDADVEALEDKEPHAIGDLAETAFDAAAEAPVEITDFDSERDIVGVFYSKTFDSVTGKPIVPKISITPADDGFGQTIALDGWDVARVIGKREISIDDIALIEK